MNGDEGAARATCDVYLPARAKEQTQFQFIHNNIMKYCRAIDSWVCTWYGMVPAGTWYQVPVPVKL
jgi:hypothetical protein